MVLEPIYGPICDLIEHLRAHESGDMSHVSQNTLFERRTVIKITPVIQFLEIQVGQAPKNKIRRYSRGFKKRMKNQLKGVFDITRYTIRKIHD